VIRLAVRVAREQSELVLAELLELAPAGVEEVELGEGTVEYAVYGAPGELPGLPDLDAAVGDAVVEISTTEIADDWGERWKQFHRPILIPAPTTGDTAATTLPALHVRPPWEAPSDLAEGTVREIVIDPGQAFGTGAHASTRMCLELLLELAAGQRPHGPLLDVGTGSGVLAIAAAALGFDPVLGLDHELESVQAAGENAIVNSVEIEVRPMGRNVRRLSLLSGGERSMAALAFLFAVFRSRPSPFYMMDEVEAALDDVNLQRFLSLVDEFRNEAQLLIVTHQKRTMEAADALYGVTMVPGGSSKVLSQRVRREGGVVV